METAVKSVVGGHDGAGAGDSVGLGDGTGAGV